MEETVYFLVGEEGAEFEVPLTYVCSWSRTFDVMMSKRWEVSEDDHVLLPEVDMDVFDWFVNCSSDDIDSSKDIKPGNLAGALVFFQKYNIDADRYSLWQHINSKNISILLNSKDFSNLSEENLAKITKYSHSFSSEDMNIFLKELKTWVECRPSSAEIGRSIVKQTDFNRTNIIKLKKYLKVFKIKETEYTNMLERLIDVKKAYVLCMELRSDRYSQLTDPSKQIKFRLDSVKEKVYGLGDEHCFEALFMRGETVLQNSIFLLRGKHNHLTLNIQRTLQLNSDNVTLIVIDKKYIEEKGNYQFILKTTSGVECNITFIP